jgi:hypothetical protein
MYFSLRILVTFRLLVVSLAAAFLITGCAELDAFLAPDPVVYVGDRPYPIGFDPYYNQPKIYRQPRYYESTTKKTKGKRVFKTTTVKDEYGTRFTRRRPRTRRRKRRASPSGLNPER